MFTTTQGWMLEAVRFILQRYNVHITMVKSPKIKAKIAVQNTCINTTYTNTSQFINFTVHDKWTIFNWLISIPVHCIGFFFNFTVLFSETANMWISLNVWIMFLCFWLFHMFRWWWRTEYLYACWNVSVVLYIHVVSMSSSSRATHTFLYILNICLQQKYKYCLNMCVVIKKLWFI